jgi:hypothetical protein
MLWWGWNLGVVVVARPRSMLASPHIAWNGTRIMKIHYFRPMSNQCSPNKQACEYHGTPIPNAIIDIIFKPHHSQKISPSTTSYRVDVLIS